MTTKEALDEYAQEVRRQALRMVPYMGSKRDMDDLAEMAMQFAARLEAMSAAVAVLPDDTEGDAFRTVSLEMGIGADGIDRGHPSMARKAEAIADAVEEGVSL